MPDFQLFVVCWTVFVSLVLAFGAGLSIGRKLGFRDGNKRIDQPRSSNGRFLSKKPYSIVQGPMNSDN